MHLLTMLNPLVSNQFPSGITCFICFFMLRLNFYINSVEQQISNIAGQDSAYTTTALSIFFNIALPAGGIISIPLIGYILDTCSHPTTFFLLVIFGSALNIVGMIPLLPLQFLSITLFALLRPFVYSSCNDFCTKRFGFSHFGKMYGLVFLSAGIFNLLQYPLISLSTWMDGSFLIANSILAIMTFLTLVFPIILLRKRWEIVLIE